MDYLDYIESQALPSVGVPEFSPSPIKKPGRKDKPEEKSLDGRCLPNQSIGDVWSYIPDCILKNWRRSQAIPGHFVVVATAPTSPLLQWQGPNIMSARTGTKEVIQYIKDDLGIYWTEWVEICVTGYSSPSHPQSPPSPVWTRIEAFHVDGSSHLSDCDGLGAVRDEAIYHDQMFNMPYLRVVIIICPPR
ncbi:hypothetical protein N7448_011359 [Penicillium atrosanguineum]|nr:hypothetical protein N7448_011359 [Penicillium atrosanguineum]